MSRKRSRKEPVWQQATVAGKPAASRKSLILIGIMAATVALAIALFGLWISRQAQMGAQRSVPQPAGAPGAMPTVAASFASLEGQWKRADNDHRLTIHHVAAGGAVEVSYQSPRPVRIARAQASAPGGVLRLFVELGDAAAAGSSYELAYNPQLDCLQGTFFNALIGQRFQIMLQRAP